MDMHLLLGQLVEPLSDLLYAPVSRSCSILHRFTCYEETFAFSKANSMTHPPAIKMPVNPIRQNVYRKYIVTFLKTPQ